MKLIIIFLLTCVYTFGQNKSIDTNEVLSTVNPEIMAEYPGGTKAMFKYLRDSVLNKIKITNDESYIIRTVYSKITIDETGKVTNPKIIKSSNVSSVDSLVIKALTNMPNWKPGSMNGVIKKQDFNIPLRFEFKD
jgi:periplasmic protein TonB